MEVLLWGLTFFGLAFIAHFILWKIYLPKSQIKALLFIFLCTLLIGLIGLLNVKSSLMGLSVPDTLPEYIHISLLYISFMLAYIVTYSAIEVDSPSMVMVLKIVNAGSGGLDEAEFDKTMTDDILVKPRISDIVTAELAYMDGDKYRLTPKGILLARIFIFYRKLMNNTSKGG
ncbi:MAG: Uncharacterized protein FD156_1772 [Nitrospirae bacterium]|nr:MAG: Uncharacterized protein FD156_1772 [Nitrospirota bacterium]